MSTLSLISRLEDNRVINKARILKNFCYRSIPNFIQLLEQSELTDRNDGRLLLIYDGIEIFIRYETGAIKALINSNMVIYESGETHYGELLRYLKLRTL